jgi:DNA-binding NarL/FixJ family response regulator
VPAISQNQPGVGEIKGLKTSHFQESKTAPLDPGEIAIYSLADRGWSQRRIASELGINRETVPRYLRLRKFKATQRQRVWRMEARPVCVLAENAQT